MNAERFFSIVRRVNAVILLSAALSMLVFLLTVAWNALANLLKPSRGAR